MTTDYKYSFDGTMTNDEPRDDEFIELYDTIYMLKAPFKVYLENKDIDLYLYIEHIDMSEYEQGNTDNIIEISVVPSFSSLSEKNQESILSQYDEQDRETMKSDTFYLLHDILSYGFHVPLRRETVTAEQVEHAIKSAKAIHSGITGLIGFELDRIVNRIGNTGWDFLDEFCNDKDLLQMALSRYDK